MRRYDLSSIVAALAVLAMVASGCAVEGKPIAAQPDPATLDVGPFGVDGPLAEPRNDSEAHGRVLESIRMGEAVVDPFDVDPALTFGLGSVASVPIPTPAKAGFLAAPVRAVLERHGMLAGFSVGGTDQEISAQVAVGRAKLLTVMLLRFPDAEAARKTAGEIDAVDTAVSPENVAVRLAEHPGAYAHWRPTVPTLAATISEGPFVISVLAGHTAPDLAVLSGLASAAFTAQLTRVREFVPTPSDKFAQLPLDRDGMLARLLPEAPGLWPVPTVIAVRNDENAGWRTGFIVAGVVYGPRAAGRYGSWEKVYDEEEDDGGMLLAVNGGHVLVKHSDAAEAREAFVETVSELNEQGQRAAPPPTGLPDGRCTESLASAGKNALRYACRVLYRQYEAITYGRTLREAQQKIAAQYALLVRSE
ncbi:DUF7373 family lipoprotein [Nocardia goodfellowii]|uniref:Uncharacterized protein n=1 Tax=Nocardia goodfellowii TaxID=882446 RepID=A0ABS4QIT1_9NOCA|nr:hypothetical protein [Nocardia goodfellowii]MBP2190959.1 hypothetical protein [Nocardia goodfellowii]